MPHLTVDPIVVSSQVISSIQTIVSRNINPLLPAVISFGSINGGDAFNVIPNEVSLSGTIRSFDKEIRKFIPTAIENILKAQKISSNCDYEFTYVEKYPPLVNDNLMTDFVKKSVSKIIGEDNVIELELPNMGAEDFSYFTTRVPSCFFFVGISKDINKPVLHHHPSFQWDDKNLKIVSSSFVQIAIDFLKE